MKERKPLPELYEPKNALFEASTSMGKSIAPFVIAMILMSMISMLVILWNSFFKLDVLAQQNLLDRAENAIETELLYLENTLKSSK